MMIPGAINRDYCALDLFVQRQMVNEQIDAKSITFGKVLVVDVRLRDKRLSTSYKIRVIYHSQKLHGVWILEPVITPTMAIHMYDDHSLCLYYPPDISPYRRIWVGQDLITMATLWVYHYERWLTNGHVWKGWELPNHWQIMQRLQYQQARISSQLRSLGGESLILANS